MSKRKLKPCPFCNTEDISMIKSYTKHNDDDDRGTLDFVYVGCAGCGIGYHEETEEEAIKAWNTRH